MSPPLRPGSFPSSEDLDSGHFSHNNVQNFSGSYSSAGTTSITSFDYIPQESSQTVARPEHYNVESDLHAFGFAFDSQDENIAQDLEADLGGQTGAAQTTSVVSDSQTILGRTMIGIQSADPLDVQLPHEEAISHVLDVYRSIVSGLPCPHDQVTKAVESLDVLKKLFNSKRAQPPPSTVGSEKDKEVFQCMLCEGLKKRQLIFHSWGTLKRHLGSMHKIYDTEFCCSELDCLRTFYRRDKLREHLSIIHHMANHTTADVDATRVKIASPRNCPICFKDIQSWDQVFRHIKDHCQIRSPAIGTPANGTRSRVGGKGSRKGGENNPRHGPVAEQSSAHGQHRSNHGNQPWNTRDFLHPDDMSFGDFRPQTNIRPPAIMPAVPDNQFNPSHRQTSQLDAGDYSFDELFGADHDPTFHNDGGISQPPTHSFAPQDPGTSQSDHLGQKRKRSFKQAQKRNPKPPSPRKCTRCNHDLGNCERCSHITESVRHCHKCTDPLGVAMNEPVPESSVQPRQDSSSIIALNPRYLGFDFPLFPESTDPQLFHGMYLNMFYPEMQDPETQDQHQAFDSANGSFTDFGSSGNSFIGAALIVEDHSPLYDINSKVQQSAIFDCDLKLLQSLGLGLPMIPLASKSHHKQEEETASLGCGPTLYTDLVFRERASSSSTPKAPEPASQCQCPCVTLPAVNYRAVANAQLSPYERVEMTFKMTPASRESSHPLRTRVQVFVKLFKLRASISKSNTTNKPRNRSITSEISTDEGETDTDSDYVLSPVSPSGSELAPTILWTEDVQDWSFDFDLIWALSRLAQWTSGATAEACSKLFLSDPGHILDLISMYIMYKFRLSWCLLSRDDSSFFLGI